MATGFADPTQEAEFLRQRALLARMPQLGCSALAGLLSVAAALSQWPLPVGATVQMWLASGALALGVLALMVLLLPPDVSGLRAMACIALGYCAWVLADHWLGWWVGSALLAVALAWFGLQFWQQCALLALGLLLAGLALLGHTPAGMPPDQWAYAMFLPILGFWNGLRLVRIDRTLFVLNREHNARKRSKAATAAK